MKYTVTGVEKYEIRKLDTHDFKQANPFKKLSCADCIFCKGYVTLWCLNKEAIKERGTSIPGVIFCYFWQPDWSRIKKEYKTSDNGYVSVFRRALTKIKSILLLTIVEKNIHLSL